MVMSRDLALGSVILSLGSGNGQVMDLGLHLTEATDEVPERLA